MHISTKIAVAIISALLTLVSSIGAWWFNRVNTSMDTLTKAVIELQTEAKFFHGRSANIKTPLQLPEEKK